MLFRNGLKMQTWHKKKSGDWVLFSVLPLKLFLLIQDRTCSSPLLLCDHGYMHTCTQCPGLSLLLLLIPPQIQRLYNYLDWVMNPIWSFGKLFSRATTLTFTKCSKVTSFNKNAILHLVNTWSVSCPYPSRLLTLLLCLIRGFVVITVVFIQPPWSHLHAGLA